MYMCVRDIAFSYFYDFSIEFLELFRRCDTYFSFYYRLWKKNYDDESATGPPWEILQGGVWEQAETSLKTVDLSWMYQKVMNKSK
jgi:hypothetical protein